MTEYTQSSTELSQLLQSLANTSETKDLLLEAALYLTGRQQLTITRKSFTAGLPLVAGRLTPELFVRACERLPIGVRVEHRSLLAIPHILLPAVVLLNDDQALLLLEIDTSNVTVMVPGSNEQHTLPIDQLEPLCDGYVIFTHFESSLTDRAELPTEQLQSHWFWGVLAQSWKIYRDVLVASVLINLFVLANPLFVMNVYDRVVPNDALETLWVLAIGVSLVFILDMVLKLLRTYFIEVAGKKSDIMLSAYILERVLGAKYSEHPASTGSFVAQLREFESLRNFITSATVTALVDLPFVIFFLAVMGYIGGVVAWVPIAIIPIILIYAWIVQRFLRTSVAHTFVASAQKNATLVEGVTNLETVKALASESRIQTAWEDACGQLARWGLISRLLSTSAGVVTVFLQQIASVLIVVVGVYAIAERELTMGALIACVILGARVLSPLAQIVGLLVQYQQSALALKSLNTIVNTQQERSKRRHLLQCDQLRGDIEFRDVGFNYPNDDVSVLTNISLRISAGEQVAIIGRLGSGKTTLQKLLTGLYQPVTGTILIDGIDIRQLDPADLRDRLAYVAQDSALFYGSLRDNLTWKNGANMDAGWLRVADLCGVTDIANAHPMGFDRPIRERGEGLSGGQKQAVIIARSLMNSPVIFLLDEPTTGMDNATESQLIANLKEETLGKTLLLVTHKTSLLSMVERVIVLDKGRVAADGPKDTVLDALKNGQVRVS